MKLQEEQQKYAAQRKSAVGTGDDLKELEHITILKAVTDHRIGLTYKS